MTAHAHHDPFGPYLVQLLLPAAARLDADKLGESLRRREPSASPTPDDPLTFSLVEGHDAASRGFAAFSVTAGLAHPDEVRAALSQTWDWPEAEDALGKAAATVLVSLESPVSLDRRVKLRRMHALLLAVAEQVEPLALHWLASQRLVEPARWRESVQHGAPPADHAINVRLFKVPDGHPGEGLMDTLGLTALGLRDLQCHFRGLDVGEVAQLLFAYAGYAFEKGDVLDDDSLVRGVVSHEEWECRLERSLARPDRDVVDLKAGAHAVPR